MDITEWNFAGQLMAFMGAIVIPYGLLALALYFLVKTAVYKGIKKAIPEITPLLGKAREASEETESVEDSR